METTQGNESPATEIATGGTDGGSTEAAEATADTGGTESGTEPGIFEKLAGGADSSAEPEVDAKALDAAIEAYKPNLKYKVLDKEFDFDESFKDAIKNEATEKKVRELYEKAHGIDHIKEERQNIKTEFSQLKEKFQNTSSALESLGGYVARNDFDSFFTALNIPTDKVLQYALEVAQRTPEQSQAIMQQRQAANVASDYERQRQELSQSQQEFAVKQRTFELEQGLSKPEVTGFIEMFDSKVGKPGAFREEVIKRGQLHAARGEDVGVDAAIGEVLNLLRPVYGEHTQARANAPKVVAAPTHQPTIPNIPSSGSSAVKRSPNSIADLHKLRDLAASGGL